MFCTACNFDLRGLPSAKCPECGRPFDPADPTTYLPKLPSRFARPFKHLLIALAILVVCAIVLGIGLFINGAYIAKEAELRYQTPTLVCDLIIEHIEKSPTHSWPTSWKDLESLPPRVEVFAWPKDADKVRRYVSVDFTVTVAQVLKQTPQTCTAIKSTPGPIYGIPPGLYGFFERLQVLDATPAPASYSPSPAKSPPD